MQNKYLLHGISFAGNPFLNAMLLICNNNLFFVKIKGLQKNIHIYIYIHGWKVRP